MAVYLARQVKNIDRVITQSKYTGMNLQSVRYEDRKLHETYHVLTQLVADTRALQNVNWSPLPVLQVAFPRYRFPLDGHRAQYVGIDRRGLIVGMY